ncbi:hypothetical protein SprV_0902768200 [Sparganum proliferum]
MCRTGSYGSSRLLALRLCHAAFLSASHSLSIRCWEARGLSLASRVLQANQRCPPSDWLANAETTEGAHALEHNTSKADSDNNLPGERARGDCLQSLGVRAFQTVKVVRLKPSSLTFDWESLSCRLLHYFRHSLKRNQQSHSGA